MILDNLARAPKAETWLADGLELSLNASIFKTPTEEMAWA
jgi:hypothetical protein